MKLVQHASSSRLTYDAYNTALIRARHLRAASFARITRAGVSVVFGVGRRMWTNSLRRWNGLRICHANVNTLSVD